MLYVLHAAVLYFNLSERFAQAFIPYRLLLHQHLRKAQRQACSTAGRPKLVRKGKCNKEKEQLTYIHIPLEKLVRCTL